MRPIFKWLVAASGMLFVGFMAWYFHTIVFYILTAAVVALIGRPFMNLLAKIKIRGHVLPTWLRSTATLIILGSLFFGIAAAFIPILIDQLKFLSSFDVAKVDMILRDPIHEIENAIRSIMPSLDFSIRELLLEQITPFISSGIITQTLNSLTNLVVDFVMAIFCVSFISFFFLKDDGLFKEIILMTFPPKFENQITRAMSSITNLLVRYFIGICVESAIKLIFVTIGVHLFGVDWSTSIIIGLVTAVLNVVPYIGPIIGGLISFVILAINPIPGVELTGLILEVGLVLLVFQLIDNIILQPYIYSSSVKAHPLEIFIVILMAGYMAGVMGMLFAIPSYTVIRVIAKEFFNNLRVVQKLTENI